MNRFALLLILFGLMTNVTLGQYQRVVIIDTLTGKHSFDIWTSDNHIDFEWDEHNKLDREKFPNFVGHIFFKNAESKLRILIDDKDGYIELSNVSNADTIHISHIHVFHNCLSDSVYMAKDWYRENPKDSSEHVEYLSTEYTKDVSRKHHHNYATRRERLSHRKLMHEQCTKRFPKQYNINVNNQQYTAPLYLIWNGGLIQKGHGRRPIKRYLKYERTGIYKPYKYSHYITTIVYHSLHAEVTLH